MLRLEFKQKKSGRVGNPNFGPFQNKLDDPIKIQTSDFPALEINLRLLAEPSIQQTRFLFQ